MVRSRPVTSAQAALPAVGRDQRFHHGSRRDFLAIVAGAALAAPALAKSNEPQAQFPTSPRDRLAVTSYPFRAYIESPANRGRKADVPGMDLTRFPALMVEKFGVHNVNPLVDHFRSTDASYIEEFRKALADAHSRIVDLGLPGRPFYSPEKTVRQAAVEAGRKWIDIAVAVGSPSVRQHVHGARNQKADVDLAGESLGELAEYGAKRNVVVNLENDDPVSEDPFFLVGVIEKVGNPYLRGLPDFGNSLIGHDQEFNERGVAAMLKHAFNMCHVKDVVQGDSGKTYHVDLKRMFELAKSSSYRGYFSMECETESTDPFTGTKRLVDESLKYLT